jgi:hypothetical protein
MRERIFIARRVPETKIENFDPGLRNKDINGVKYGGVNL